jgi:hypothetical protein
MKKWDKKVAYTKKWREDNKERFLKNKREIWL